MFKCQRYCRVSLSVFQSVMSSTPVKVKGGITNRPISYNRPTSRTRSKNPNQGSQIKVPSAPEVYLVLTVLGIHMIQLDCRNLPVYWKLCIEL